MKILEIGTGYTSIPARMGAATEIVVECLSRSLRSMGHDVTIVDISDKHRLPTTLPIVEVPMAQAFSDTDTSLGIVHKLKRVAYSLSLARTLRKIIKRSPEPLVLHFHNQYNLFFFLKLTPKRLLEHVTIGYTVHSYVWHGNWDDIRDVVKKRYFQEVYCCRHAHKVFTLNPVVTGMLTEHCGVDPQRVTQVINGIATDVYKPLSGEDLAAARAEFGVNDSERVVLQVGSVCERKNQLGTLRSLMPLLLKRRDVVFAFAGGIISNDYLQQIMDEARASGVESQVRHMGELQPGEQLNRLYNLAQVAVMNSTSEAFCLVVFEALAAGTPTVVNSAIMHSQPSFASHENDGIIPMDDDFATQVGKLLDDQNRLCNLSLRGREMVTSTFGWDVAAEQYVAEFERSGQ